MDAKNIIWFKDLGIDDVAQVGGKNASLGEMIQHLSSSGVVVPNGFATTADAFRDFLKYNHLENKIYEKLNKLDVSNLRALKKTGGQIRKWIEDATFSDELIADITKAYDELASKFGKTFSVAVRSSATAEDLPEASFAGQQETYLNVCSLKQVLWAIKKVFASLFNDRAIAYRVHNNFEHSQVALSAGIQYMIRSDIGASGVAFSIDTETGFSNAILINSSYGLGEMVVQGAVNPDEYFLYKPNIEKDICSILRKKLGQKAIKMIYRKRPLSKKFTKIVSVNPKDRLKFALSDKEVEALGKHVLAIERHYKKPMDVEWGKDGRDGKLYILQARPETVESRVDRRVIEEFNLKEKGKVLISGCSIGHKIGAGKVSLLKSTKEMNKFREGNVLVTDMTDPDWEPIMKKSAAIVTNRGGRTCHAAIVARELGIPAIVGTCDATKKIANGKEVTVSCAEGDTGFVYEGLVKYDVKKTSVDKMPELPVKIMLNMANPDNAFALSFLPNHGVGLARLEFIINDMISMHPNALLNFKILPTHLKKIILKRTAGYENPVEFYIEKLKEGVATIGAAFYPKPVIVRLSDFKTNEYANLIGGSLYEPHEENPMIGFRGAGRYADEKFKACFALECEALRRVRDDMGLTNVEVMIPFPRTVKEASNVIKIMAENGLKRGQNGLRIILMCEVPSNAILAEDFLEICDGFSIGSNDLTQLTLGLDRDSELVSELFDERDKAVKFLLSRAISTCLRLNKYIGICGQGPSDHPDLAKWLLDQNIGSMSLNPDTVIATWLYIAGID